MSAARCLSEKDGAEKGEEVLCRKQGGSEVFHAARSSLVITYYYSSVPADD